MDESDLAALSDLRIAALRELVFARLDAGDKALSLQAKELRRRLKRLNGEHRTLMEMRATYVEAVVYDRDLDRMRSEFAAAKREMDATRAAADAAAIVNRRNTLVAVGGLVSALVGWGLTLVVHFAPIWSGPVR